LQRSQLGSFRRLAVTFVLRPIRQFIPLCAGFCRLG
jgi:hypothetical protein